MPDFAIARALHVLAIVMWIGGVALVTTVLLPAIRQAAPPAERFPLFHRLEARFARQSRVTTALAGASGLYMLWRLGAWDRFCHASFWWMHAMVLTWLVFTLMLFVIEPLFLERRLARRAAAAPEATWRRRRPGAGSNGCTGSCSASASSPLPGPSPAVPASPCSTDRPPPVRLPLS
jgi:uncharacterized membrane protein